MRALAATMVECNCEVVAVWNPRHLGRVPDAIASLTEEAVCAIGV